MKGFGDEWEEFAERLARELAPALKRSFYGVHLERIGVMRTPSEKLVYLYLVLSQPQSFTSIRRALSLSRKTVDVALKRLVTAGFVVQDERYLYWIVE